MSQNSNFTAQVRSRTARVTTAVLMGTVLTGCAVPNSGPGASRYDPTYLRMTGEHAFAQGLRRNYLELATNAFDRGDAARSDFYSLRALMAAEGKLAHPAKHSGGGEIGAVGARLAQLLSTGVRTGSPDLAARAQAAFDCWKLESGPNGDARIAQSCRFNAMNALAELEGASTGAQLTVAGGPRQPQGQTYVIEDGMPSQTIHAANGYTIEIITEHHAAAPQHQQYVSAPAPATYTTTVAQPAQSYTMQAAPAPQMIEQAPAINYVEAAPVRQEYIAMAPQPTHSTGYAIEESIPTVAVDDYAMMVAPSYTGTSMAVPVAELAPIESTQTYQPSYEMAPIQTIPVFDTQPVESMPMVEMSAMPSIEMTAMPMANDGGAVQTLVEGTTSLRGDFAIFFGFDSDEVTIEADDILIDAVEQIKLSGTNRVTLMGFTDSAGDSRYNQLLAMRRAQSVRKALQDKLGDSISFEILPVGELQAVQNGGDGVKEALNRKVEIGLR